jgi:hypothetical protein
MTIDEDGGGGDIYTFSNSNFTDVKRELQLSSADGMHGPNGADMQTTDLTGLMKGAPTLPPGLRFPFGAILGHYLIIAGTYLSASVQQFSTWSLDLWTWQWQKIDAMALEKGSWNKAALWEDQAKLVVFGNRDSDLQQDCECNFPGLLPLKLIQFTCLDERRCINFDHLAIIELEIFGVYLPPHPPATKTEYQSLALQILHSSVNCDFEVVCEDGRSIKCSRTILLKRWPWFKAQHDRAQREANELVDAAAQQSSRMDLPVTLSSARLTPRQLHLSEPYPVVLALLEYLYTESLVTTLQHRPPILSALLMISKQYRLDHLTPLVVHAMHERLNETTALGVYEIATLCGCVCLQVRALKIVLVSETKRPSVFEFRFVSEYRASHSSYKSGVMEPPLTGEACLPARSTCPPPRRVPVPQAMRVFRPSTRFKAREGPIHTTVAPPVMAARVSNIWSNIF